MAGLLFIDARCDLDTEYCYAFRNLIVFSDFPLRWPRHTLIQLTGPNAQQPHVDASISNNSVRYISGTGHGLQDTFTGFQGGVIWSATQDLSSLAGTIVHLLSCQTAVSLGHAMLRDGVRAFWGYTADFSFPCEKTPPSDLTKDAYAARFLEMDCLIDEGILDGKSAVEVYADVLNYVARLSSTLSKKHYMGLINNLRHLVSPVTTSGDPLATL